MREVNEDSKYLYVKCYYFYYFEEWYNGAAYLCMRTAVPLDSFWYSTMLHSEKFLG